MLKDTLVWELFVVGWGVFKASLQVCSWLESVEQKQVTQVPKPRGDSEKGGKKCSAYLAVTEGMLNGNWPHYGM